MKSKKNKKKDLMEEQNNLDKALEENIIDDKCQNCEQYKLGWQRAQADYINLQKQIEENRSELVRLSELQILEEFIPVYSNFKKCMDSSVENDTQIENWKKGVKYIMKQFSDILDQHGVEKIKSVGEVFNPSMHEALAEEESDQSAGIIIKEIDSGFIMNGKVIKPAKVIVSK